MCACVHVHCRLSVLTTHIFPTVTYLTCGFPVLWLGVQCTGFTSPVLLWGLLLIPAVIDALHASCGSLSIIFHSLCSNLNQLFRLCPHVPLPLPHPHAVYISGMGVLWLQVASVGLILTFSTPLWSILPHKPVWLLCILCLLGDSLSSTMECCLSWLSNQGTPSSTPNDVSLACSYASFIMWLSCDINAYKKLWISFTLPAALSRGDLVCMKWWLGLVLHLQVSPACCDLCTCIHKIKYFFGKANFICKKSHKFL